MTAPSRALTYHRLKIVLRGVAPPVWRRLEVRSDASLAQLHRVVQTAMGWDDYHLHQWLIGDVFYGVDDGEEDPPPKDESMAKLERVAPAGTRIYYEYDFGDSWQHDIDVEAVVAAPEGAGPSRCVDGARGCPPEDCGGVTGYAHLLDALSDHDHTEHQRLVDWVGGTFDAEHFDIDAVNASLARNS